MCLGSFGLIGFTVLAARAYRVREYIVLGLQGLSFGVWSPGAWDLLHNGPC